MLGTTADKEALGIVLLLQRPCGTADRGQYSQHPQGKDKSGGCDAELIITIYVQPAS